MASEITRITVTAAAPEDAEYLYDLIKAARITAGQAPVRFNSARILKIYVPADQLGKTAYLIPEPAAGLQGRKILSEETEEFNTAIAPNSESLLGKYIYADAAGTEVEIIQEY